MRAREWRRARVNTKTHIAHIICVLYMNLYVDETVDTKYKLHSIVTNVYTDAGRQFSQASYSKLTNIFSRHNGDSSSHEKLETIVFFEAVGVGRIESCTD